MNIFGWITRPFVKRRIIKSISKLFAERKPEDALETIVIGDKKYYIVKVSPRFARWSRQGVHKMDKPKNVRMAFTSTELSKAKKCGKVEELILSRYKELNIDPMAYFAAGKLERNSRGCSILNLKRRCA